MEQETPLVHQLFWNSLLVLSPMSEAGHLQQCQVEQETLCWHTREAGPGCWRAEHFLTAFLRACLYVPVGPEMCCAFQTDLSGSVGWWVSEL